MSRSTTSRDPLALLNNNSLAVGAGQKRSRVDSASSTWSTAKGQQKLNFSRFKYGVTTDGKFGKLTLSDEQRQVLKMVVQERKSVFFTGAAGTGKSVLLRKIISDLRAYFKDHSASLAVTASTGLAAFNIGGVTLHSFAGVGLGKEDAETLVKKVRRNPQAFKRWRTTKVLVIDEVSMIEGAFFDKLDHLARTVRRRDKEPFGGIQIVLTGDFYQLPPVAKGKAESDFIFESKAWETCLDETFELRNVFRQKDEEFARMLTEIRSGAISPATEAKFKSLNRPLQNCPAEITPTELFPLRHQVDRANQAQLKGIANVEYKYDCIDEIKNEFFKSALDSLLCLPSLSLKKGSQVMMIKNVDETLVNGSVGIVKGFMSESTFSLIDEDDHDFATSLTSQDFDADGRYRDNDYTQASEKSDNVFENELYEKTDSVEAANAMLARKRATKAQQDYMTKAVGQVFPYVEFTLTDGTKRSVLCQPEKWVIEDADGNVVVTRTQVPLILAWALSIHKSQGQTIQWLKVNLSNVFEKGQSYVALSRAVSLDQIQVVGFNRNKVMVHSKVVDFYRQLRGVGESTTVANKENTLQDDGENDILEISSAPLKKADALGVKAIMREIDSRNDSIVTVEDASRAPSESGAVNPVKKEKSAEEIEAALAAEIATLKKMSAQEFAALFSDSDEDDGAFRQGSVSTSIPGDWGAKPQGNELRK